ncbi:MAG TPA: TonB-dependent receptor, partial [Leeuwenhoekiella sp.]|nr:TonB-dependent receptor [Leeuwenhoekiella sp.]
MKQIILLIVGLLALQQGAAQDFQLNGTIKDNNGVPLESATVYVEKISDSTLVTYGISDREGFFEMEGRTDQEQLNLFVSYAGFKPLRQVITIKPNIALGEIKLEVQDNLLDEVIVVADRAPVTLKKDTLEFNANSFKTRPDANLEELLKKLPGAEVDSDGAITINGKPVSRILVNGKEFFGD